MKPAGFIQKGRSRFWYRDFGWYAVSAEFQPSSWSRGTYFNLAVSWLWYPNDCWSFDHDVRRVPFVEYICPTTFQDAALKMAHSAVVYADTKKDAFATLNSAYRTVSNANLGGRANLHTGILASLAGHTVIGANLIRRAMITDPEYDWHHDLNLYATDLLSNLDHPSRLCAWLNAKVAENRSNLKLQQLGLNFFPY